MNREQILSRVKGGILALLDEVYDDAIQRGTDRESLVLGMLDGITHSLSIVAARMIFNVQGRDPDPSDPLANQEIEQLTNRIGDGIMNAAQQLVAAEMGKRHWN